MSDNEQVPATVGTLRPLDDLAALGATAVILDRLRAAGFPEELDMAAEARAALEDGHYAGRGSVLFEIGSIAGGECGPDWARDLLSRAKKSGDSEAVLDARTKVVSAMMSARWNEEKHRLAETLRGCKGGEIPLWRMMTGWAGEGGGADAFLAGDGSVGVHWFDARTSTAEGMQALNSSIQAAGDVPVACASVPLSGVDWRTTLLCRMDADFHEENEFTLKAEATVRPIAVLPRGEERPLAELAAMAAPDLPGEVVSEIRLAAPRVPRVAVADVMQAPRLNAAAALSGLLAGKEGWRPFSAALQAWNPSSGLEARLKAEYCDAGFGAVSPDVEYDLARAAAIPALSEDASAGSEQAARMLLSVRGDDGHPLPREEEMRNILEFLRSSGRTALADAVAAPPWRMSRRSGAMTAISDAMASAAKPQQIKPTGKTKEIAL